MYFLLVCPQSFYKMYFVLIGPHQLDVFFVRQEGREYEGPKPTWYRAVPDQFNGGKLIHEYQGGYWEAKEQQDWAKCADIF